MLLDAYWIFASGSILNWLYIVSELNLFEDFSRANIILGVTANSLWQLPILKEVPSCIGLPVGILLNIHQN